MNLIKKIISQPPSPSLTQRPGFRVLTDVLSESEEATLQENVKALLYQTFVKQSTVSTVHQESITYFTQQDPLQIEFLSTQVEAPQEFKTFVEKNKGAICKIIKVGVQDLEKIYGKRTFWQLNLFLQYLDLPSKGMPAHIDYAKDPIRGRVPSSATVIHYLHEGTEETFINDKLTIYTSDLQTEVGQITPKRGTTVSLHKHRGHKVGPVEHKERHSPKKRLSLITVFQIPSDPPENECFSTQNDPK